MQKIIMHEILVHIIVFLQVVSQFKPSEYTCRVYKNVFIIISDRSSKSEDRQENMVTTIKYIRLHLKVNKASVLEIMYKTLSLLQHVMYCLALTYQR